jgi:hypothetical protein
MSLDQSRKTTPAPTVIAKQAAACKIVAMAHNNKACALREKS